MGTRHILHCDMNCFYASVEMQRHPELRDTPLAVCGSQEERHGIVLTANYIAKPYGVKTGMAIWQAKQRCPQLVTLPPDMDEYIRISRYAREIYEDYTDQVEPFGLDENWLDVTGSVGLYGSPMTIAREISSRIKSELGITASIGVANNKITAKLGSDYKKPDAITRIEQDNYKEIVYPLPVEDLLYVGPATSKKLRAIGIDTIGRLAECPEELLQRRLGKMGLVLSMFAKGRDVSPVQKTDHIGCLPCAEDGSYSKRQVRRQQRHHAPGPGIGRRCTADAAPAGRKRLLPDAGTGIPLHGGGDLCPGHGTALHAPAAETAGVWNCFAGITIGSARSGASGCAAPAWWRLSAPSRCPSTRRIKGATNGSGSTGRWTTCASGTAT